MTKFLRIVKTFGPTLILLTLMCVQARAVQKPELLVTTQAEAEKALKEIASLDKRYKEAEPARKKTFDSKIALRVANFIEPIQKIPEADLDEQLAEWSKQSLVAELKGLGVSFLFGEDISEAAYQSYKNRASSAFSVLTGERGEMLLARRNKLQSSLVAAKSDFRKFLQSKFSSISSIKLNIKDPYLLGFYEALGSSTTEPSGDIDLRNDRISSEIMTRAMIKRSTLTLSKAERVFDLGFFSLLSPIFKTELPTDFKIYESSEVVVELWNKAYNATYTKDEQFPVFDAELLDQFVWDGIEIAYGIPKIYPKIGDKYISSVTFANDKAAWPNFLGSNEK